MLVRTLQSQLQLLVLIAKLLHLGVGGLQISLELLFTGLELFELQDNLLLFFRALLELGLQLLVHSVDAFLSGVGLLAVIFRLLELQTQSVEFGVQKELLVLLSALILQGF
jgi:hypothetical protein